MRRFFILMVLCLSAGTVFPLEDTRAEDQTFAFRAVSVSDGSILTNYDPSGLLERPAALGSLIKPFTIIARYGEKEPDIGEEHFCSGFSEVPDGKRCWLKKGHRRMTLIPALGYSCNSYFYEFAKSVDFAVFLDTLRRYGLVDSRENLFERDYNRSEQIEAMVGRMRRIKIRPTDYLEAFRGIESSPSTVPQAVREVLEDGMRFCYRSGTASKAREKVRLSARLNILCKTGTGLYEDEKGADLRKTHGYFVAVIPGDSVWFVAVTDATGADEAAECGFRLIKEYLESRPKK